MSYLYNVISGAERGLGGRVLRAIAAGAEPVYSAITSGRNQLYDRGALASVSLGRPTISIGNLTTGGTGKTPLVKWLASELARQGRHVAVLARGYRARAGSLGDEQVMLSQSLAAEGATTVRLICNADRVAGARQALAAEPQTDLFILDDGFQHRRARRDLDIVLISAAEPFGFDHVLPRGLLREPIAGLRRAGAIIITHAEQVDPQALSRLQTRLVKLAPAVPIYESAHEHVDLLDPRDQQRLPLDLLDRTPFFAFAGIGDPASLERQLSSRGEQFRGHFWFPDHHAYQQRELAALDESARNVGAALLITTEKDLAKVQSLELASLRTRLLAIRLASRFAADDEQRLLSQVKELLTGPSRK